MALKKSLTMTLGLFVLWVLGGIIAMPQSPTIRDVERQLDRHIISGHEHLEARLARLEIAEAANTNQINLIRGGGGALALILIGLNVLNLVGWKVNLIRNNKNGG